MKTRSCRATCVTCCNRKVTEGSSMATGGSTVLHSAPTILFPVVNWVCVYLVVAIVTVSSRLEERLPGCDLTY